MIAIPFKTIQEIEAALSAPNLKELRRTLNDAASQMQPLAKLARQDRENDVANRHRFDIGSDR